MSKRWTPEARAAAAERFRRRKADPAFEARRRAAMERLRSDPAHGARVSAHFKALAEDPAYRARRGWGPRLTPRQRSRYDYLRRCGLDRETAKTEAKRWPE